MSGIRPHRLWRRLLDAVLLPFALILVLTENVLWAGAKALLRGLNRLRFMRLLRVRIARLPVTYALPLFLIPNIVSHLFEIYAAVLLAEGYVQAAVTMEVLGKGLATLLVVWIYQACAPTLLQVPWFARVHHGALALRRRTLARVVPVWARLSGRARRVPGGTSVLVQRRFRALRRWLAATLGLRAPHHH
jgi:hypothetical protein